MKEGIYSMKRLMRKGTAILLLCLMLVTLFSGCAGSHSETLFVVNGVGARRDDFMMHLFFVKYNYFAPYLSDSGTGMRLSDIYALDADVLGTEIGQGMTIASYFKLEASNSLVQAIVSRQALKENNLSITAADKTAIAQDKEKFIKTLGGAAQYNAFLKAIRSSDRAFDQYQADNYAMQKLLALFTDGGKYGMTNEQKLAAKESYAEKYITARHILLFTKDQVTGAAFSEETIAQKKAKAQEALSKLRAGEKWDDVQKEYSEDSNLTGMTFTTGTMVEAFEKAAFALQVGEFSDVVETEFGFHIIYRTELSDDQYEPFYGSLIFENFSKYLGPMVENAGITYKSAYENLIIQ
jgi:foldase protein PrsA